MEDPFPFLSEAGFPTLQVLYSCFDILQRSSSCTYKDIGNKIKSSKAGFGLLDKARCNVCESGPGRVCILIPGYGSCLNCSLTKSKQVCRKRNELYSMIKRVDIEGKEIGLSPDSRGNKLSAKTLHTFNRHIDAASKYEVVTLQNSFHWIEDKIEDDIGFFAKDENVDSFLRALTKTISSIENAVEEERERESLAQKQKLITGITSTQPPSSEFEVQEFQVDSHSGQATMAESGISGSADDSSGIPSGEFPQYHNPIADQTLMALQAVVRDASEMTPNPFNNQTLGGMNAEFEAELKSFISEKMSALEAKFDNAVKDMKEEVQKAVQGQQSNASLENVNTALATMVDEKLAAQAKTFNTNIDNKHASLKDHITSSLQDYTNGQKSKVESIKSEIAKIAEEAISKTLDELKLQSWLFTLTDMVAQLRLNNVFYTSLVNKVAARESPEDSNVARAHLAQAVDAYNRQKPTASQIQQSSTSPPPSQDMNRTPSKNTPSRQSSSAADKAAWRKQGSPVSKRQRFNSPDKPIDEE